MKEKIIKLINVLKKDGLVGLIVKSYKYLYANYLPYINIVEFLEFIIYKRKYKKEIDEILSSNTFDRIVVWRSSFGWNVQLFQRPQHISLNLANNRTLVFYETSKMTDKVHTIEKLNENLILTNFQNKLYSRYLLKRIEHSKFPKYIQLYSTDWLFSVSSMKSAIKKGFRIIYEYIDDISPALSGTNFIPKRITDKYDYTMSNEDVYVITTADVLYNDVKSKRGVTNLAFSSNGVDYNFFKDIDSSYKLEKKYLNLVSNGKINLCYYGALATWYDYDLIKKINDTNKYNIILFGIKYDNSFDTSGIGKLKNVHFLGAKPYKVLKYYANKSDILMIPFLINDITKATSPVKLFEYMALNKPIVTTDMNECRKYESVLIGHDHDEFIEMLSVAYSKRKDKKYMKILDKEALENSWNYKARAILDVISKDER